MSQSLSSKPVSLVCDSHKFFSSGIDFLLHHTLGETEKLQGYGMERMSLVHLAEESGTACSPGE